MLRFIFSENVGLAGAVVFQYISCYGLSTTISKSRATFYHISIHLMLRFIFQEKRNSWCQPDISIHLMLRFIAEAEEMVKKGELFQYISCYGLSNFQLSTRQNLQNFNTSHVTVYLRISRYAGH